MAEDNSPQDMKKSGFMDRALGRAKMKNEYESKLSMRDRKIAMIEKVLKENKQELSILQKKLDDKIRFEKSIFPLALETTEKRLKLAKIERNTIQKLLGGLSKKSLSKKMKAAKEKKFTEKLKAIDERLGELKYYKKEIKKALGK